MIMARKCQHRAALELFKKVGDTATPAEIDKHVGGTGSYYSKHVSVMRRWGFEFDVEKDGRTIVRYTLTKVPANEAEYRTQPAAAKIATKKVAPKAKSKPKAVSKPKTKKTGKEKNLDTMRSVLRKQKQEKKEMLEVLKDEPQATSYSIDADWDSTDEVDISALI